MDHVFCPGGDIFRRLLRRALERQGAVSPPPEMRRLAEFIHRLNTHSTVQRPFGDVFIGAHGWSFGNLGMPHIAIDLNNDRAEDHLDYPLLIHLLTAPGFSQQQRTAWRISSSAASATTKVHLKGCNMGQASPFVRRFKELLGGTLTVTAAKHFHLVDDMTIPDGILEYLAYDFNVQVPGDSPFAAGPAGGLKQAFIGKSAIDGNAVPTANWDAWIPDDMPHAGEFEREYPITLDPPIVRGTQRFALIGLKVPRSRRHLVENRTYRITPGEGEVLPTEHAAAMEELLSNLRLDEDYAETAEFPIHKRMFYDTVEAFVNGHTWTFKKDSAGVLLCISQRRVYKTIVPITDPATGGLIYRYTPKTGPVVNSTRPLDTADAELYLTV